MSQVHYSIMTKNEKSRVVSGTETHSTLALSRYHCFGGDQYRLLAQAHLF